jgi:hypothetical protein
LQIIQTPDHSLEIAAAVAISFHETVKGQQVMMAFWHPRPLIITQHRVTF